jgi:hypothetical protein
MSKLLGLQFTFKYRRGVDNGTADSLSRVGHLLNMVSVLTCQPQWIQELLNSYATDTRAPGSLDKGVIRYKGRLWIADNAALQSKLIATMHDSAVGGHSGERATYQRMKGLYYWPGMKRHNEEWIKQCLVCQQAKHKHTNPSGLFQPLPVLERPWAAITMDFIEGLPKYTHFLPLRHPFTAASVANLFLDSDPQASWCSFVHRV